MASAPPATLHPDRNGRHPPPEDRMTSRERVKRAIHFQGVDRMPHFLPDGGENDILWLWPAPLPPKQDWVNRGDTDWMVDEWGAVRYRAAGGVYGFGEVHTPPIPDIRRQAEYVLPELLEPRQFEPWRQAIAENEASDSPKYVLGVHGYGFFERCHALVGLDDLFVAFYEAPEQVHALLERLCQKRLETIRFYRSLGCDGVMGYEDWGLQDRLMVSLETIREFFLPRHRRMWGLAHTLGMENWMHSCGYTIEVLPLFAEAGLDVAQLDQQENMGLENLDRVLGGRLAFWCPVDIQRTMVEGSEADIERYVRRMIATLGSHRGGLISKTYPTPKDVHHDPARIAAACAAFRKYGRYDSAPAGVGVVPAQPYGVQP
jgi:hypothetical protein